MKIEKNFSRVAVMAVCVATFAAFAIAQTTSNSTKSATPKTALLVLSKQDHTLAIVDPADLRVVAHIPVGDDPHEVVASSDGHTAYVSNYGFGQFHTLTVIDLIAQHPEPQIELGALRGPHGLMFEQGKVWFTAEAAKAIGSYDPGSGKINWIMGTGQNRTHMIYVFPDAKKILTTNVNSATVTILEHTESQAGGPPPAHHLPAPDLKALELPHGKARACRLPARVDPEDLRPDLPAATGTKR